MAVPRFVRSVHTLSRQPSRPDGCAHVEIRVALIGYVSAGKSTVLNALLQNKCSEVAMGRTTAGVNLFKVSTKDTPASKSSSRFYTTTTSAQENDADSTSTEVDVVHTPEQALLRITQDNKTLRETDTVQETTFHIELDEPICDMRKDTRLVLIDIPGLNEAGSNDMYREYVVEQWDTFDCVIVVMDMPQGVNSEEQVQLLEIVRKKMNETKDLPVIVLCNKVDDPDSEEIMDFVQAISKKVESVFKNQTVSFIPISAESAFVYRMASGQSFEEFKKLDAALVDKIVCEEVGKSKWRKLDVAQRYKVAYTTISNKSNYDGSLKATNFHSFLECFNKCVGERAQLDLIQKKIEVGLKALSFDKVVAHELKCIYDINAGLGLSQTDHGPNFWKVYDMCCLQSVRRFEGDADPTHLQKAMTQLIEFDSFALGVGIHDAEHSKVVEAMVYLVSKQIGWLVKHSEKAQWLTGRYAIQPFYDWNAESAQWQDVTNGNEPYHYNHGNGYVSRHTGLYEVPNEKEPPSDSAHHWTFVPDRHGWENQYTGAFALGEHNPVDGKLSWDKLSPLDFYTMSQSILLLSYSKPFCVHFGREKLLLENVASEFKFLKQGLEPQHASIVGSLYGAGPHFTRIKTMLCDFTEGELGDDGEFIPKHPDRYSLVAQIKMPKLLSDQKHWGHLAWQFCEFMETQQAGGK